MVDEETQKNDLDIVREALKITKEVPIVFTFFQSAGKVACPFKLPQTA